MKRRKRKDTNNSQKFDEISGILAQDIYSFRRMNKKGMKSSIALACAEKVLRTENLDKWRKERRKEERKKKREL